MKKIIEESGLISIVALFVLSFLQPFGIEQMTDRRMPFIILISLVAFAVSALSFAIERTVTHRDASTVKDICLFHVINIPILSAVILSSISWFSWGNLHSAWYCTQGEFSVINYLVICVQVLLVSVFIFVMQVYRSKNDRLQKELDMMKAINGQLEHRTDDDDTEGRKPHDVITLTGNANNAVLEVCVENIIFIESMGNYANLCILKDDKVDSQSLRITMKQLRQILDKYPCMFACHRAFIVNTDYIQSVSGRHSTGYQLQMFGTDKLIPVSRTYSDELEQRIMKD